jgi:alpha-mannosidase
LIESTGIIAAFYQASLCHHESTLKKLSWFDPLAPRSSTAQMTCDDKGDKRDRRTPLTFPTIVLTAAATLLLIVASFPTSWQSLKASFDHDPFLIPAQQAKGSPNVLNVHIVPHSHDDVGWLKTVDQYYFGYNMSIQHASVHDIIDSVIASLQENPKRTFTYVEQKFFSMWWERQNDAMRDSVRFLVANNQLNFVNGGWCMHDEASTHYMGMIDQTTLGHTFLKNELGVIPRVGWQLDPFGHSSTQASLMTSRMGFDALYFGRIDYQDLQLRQLEQECEGLWNASNSLVDTTVFWGLTGSYGGNYGSPRGFCFDVNCDDPLLINMNNTALLKSMKDFLRKIRIQSDRTKGNHIMLTMGSDFQVCRP